MRSLRHVRASGKSGPNVAHVTTEENGTIVARATNLEDGRELTTRYRVNWLPDTWTRVAADGS